MEPQHFSAPQIPEASDEEVKAFIARFYPHLVEAPKVRSLSVKEAVAQQAKIASGELNAEEMMANDLIGIMVQGGMTLDIMRMQADATPWPGAFTNVNLKERERVARRVEETRRHNENPTPGIRNLVRRQFGLPERE